MPQMLAKLSLTAALVAGGLALGQDAPKPDAAKTDAKKPAPAAGENVLSLVKEGQAGRRCKVLRSYKHPSGGTAYEVKAEDTGEVMTVIEGPSAEGKKDYKIEPKEAKVSFVNKLFKPAVKDVKPVAMPPLPKEVAKPSAIKPVSATVDAPKPVADSDPILSPKDYVGNEKVLREIGDDAKPAGESWKPVLVAKPVIAAKPVPAAKPAAPQYTKPPVPAAKRWFRWNDEKPAARPVAMQAMPMPMAMPVGPVEQVTFVAATSPDPVVRLIGRLHDDLLPSMREVSAGQLAYYGRGRPEAFEALMEVAQSDPAPSVRACCVQCLGEMRVKTQASVAVLTAMQSDADPMVRAVATAALSSWQ